MSVSDDQRVVGGLFSPEALADPAPVYRSVDVPGCRHAVAAEMLRDPRFEPPVLDVAASPEAMWAMFGRWLLNLDGDRHHAMRRRFSRIFTPGRVEQYRKAIEAKANALLDAVIDTGRMDLVTDYARPLPFSIITSVLGVPEARQPWLAERMLAVDTGFARQHEPDCVRAASAATTEMLGYLGELLDERVAVPRDDLLSILAADAPTDEEGRHDLLANCVFFVEAGHVTTSSLITGGVLLLLEHREQLEALLDDPNLLPSAVEEMLRLVSPISVVMCRAREDVELGGYQFRAGEQRFVFPPGANRDPAAFPSPDAFDIARADNPHLAFSAGAHFCLGAPLARLHGEIAIATLLRRIPHLQLAGDPVWLGSIPVREPLHLPVAWPV